MMATLVLHEAPNLVGGTQAIRHASPVRPFSRRDIADVARLHKHVFAVPDQPMDENWDLSPQLMDAYRSYFDEVFLNNPWQRDGMESLVYEDEDGRIAGFLGVVPRPMELNGRTVWMTVCTQFIVDPGKRGLVGLRLKSAHLDGPQDLSVTDEANDATRRIWEGRGGGTCLPFSIHWIRPLRPARLALAAFRRRSGLGAAARAGSPLAWAADAMAAGLKGSPLVPKPSALRGEEPEPSALLAGFPRFTGGRALRPIYDDHSFDWTLRRAGLGRDGGRFHKVLLRDDAGAVAGWYLYQIDDLGLGEVLHVAAAPRTVDEVFRHLVHHARRRGVLALRGRLDPNLFRNISDKLCLMHFRGPSTLIHAKRPELLEPFHRGDAFFTRLEGEWCLRFRPEWSTPR